MKSINTAVILAAGMGSRLFDVTNDEIPKGLYKINGKSLIERSIEKLRSVGIDKIYIVTGHLSEAYEALAQKYNFVKTKKNRKYKATGSMTSLAILEDEIEDDFILLESDIVYEVYGLIKTLNYEKEDCVLLSGKTNLGDECFVEVENDNLYKISKKASDLNNIYGELVGISKISKALYKDMLKEYKLFNEKFNQHEDVLSYAKRKIKKYDYEDTIFDCAKKRKIGYLKIDDLIWGEVDDKNQLDKVKTEILPRLEGYKILMSKGI